jgi:hypothetical protein
VELIVDGKRYDVMIENLSENGMRVRTVSTDPGVNFLPDEIIALEFEIPSGGILDLDCKVK